MYQPIHLKYRPQTLAEIIGQNTTTTTLQNAVTQKKIAPSYLFIGNRGTGKTSTARILAKMINCQEETVRVPCNKCQSCLSINKGNYLDVIEIDAASNSGVEAMREVIERTQFAPVAGKYKVIIIDECHSLSGQAWQSLLKTTENPPKNVVFIFCTTESGKVPPTIVSRSQSFEFQLINNQTITKTLLSIASFEGIQLERDGAIAIANVKNGHIRDAQTLLDQLRNLNVPITRDIVYQVCGVVDKPTVLKVLTHLGTTDYSTALEIVKDLINRGKNPHKILTTLVAATNEAIVSNEHPIKFVWNNQELQQIIRIFNEKQQLVKGDFGAMWLEAILIEIARVELDKRFFDIYESWESVEDALAWGKSEIPQLDIDDAWDNIVPIEGKKTPGWINFILREKVLSLL
ncbi:MAG: DNA polymerase III subunit gamma/tau [Richelia sp. RM1_1_1]|nr:DNA polymerase III subunit gamma/tau [Richelia sp. RM1_1_1]